MPTRPAVDPALPGPAAPSAVLVVIAAGGALGALARYGAVVAWPTAPGSFPTTVLAVNLAGCALMGILMVTLLEGPAAGRRPLLRPFLGTGVLGGFTTFSTYAADGRLLFNDGRPVVALAYLLGTAAGALAAVSLTMAATRRLLGRSRGSAS